MKKAILCLVALVCLCGTALAAERTTVTKDSAGTMSHVTRYVTESGITVFEVTATGVSIYATTYNNISSVTVVGVSGEIGLINVAANGVSSVPTISGASLSGSASIANSVLPNPITSGVSTDQVAAGGIFAVNLTSSETLSGKTVYGGMIANENSISEVTGTVCALAANMSFSFEISGNTPYVIQFNSADALVGVANFNSGSSVLFVSGQAGSAYGYIRYLTANKWIISGASVSTRNK